MTSFDASRAAGPASPSSDADPRSGIDLSVDVGPLRLRNPLLAASGTYGCGEAFTELVPPETLGGIVTKSVSLEPRRGNPAPRIAETPSGMLNSIGLENKGLEHFVREILPAFRACPTARIVSIVGKTVDDFVRLAATLSEAGGIDALELNMSCPNVREGGLEFSTSPPLAESLVAAVKKASVFPVIAKLSPNVTDIVSVARAAVHGGADVLSLINTYRGVAIDWRRRRPVLGGITGGLSGPCVKPLALYLVWEVASRLPATPVIGIGGVQTAEDVLQFMAAGARAVQVGTAHFVDPTVTLGILRDLQAILFREGISRVREVIATVPLVEGPPAPAAG